MNSLDDIHRMIITADAGDGDRLLDILGAILEQIRILDQKIEAVAKRIVGDQTDGKSDEQIQ